MLLNENGRLMNDKLKVAETLNSQLVDNLHRH